MAGLGRPPAAAAEDFGNASRGSFRDSEELADDADFGLPIIGERIGALYLSSENGSRGGRGEAENGGTWQNTAMPSGRDRRRSERFPTASIPVQLSDIDCELIDLSLSGAAVIHRSPINAGAPGTLVFPSYGGIYIPCKVLRSLVQVRRAGDVPEYVFRSAISFTEMEPEQRDPLREFLQIQIARLKEKQDEAAAAEV